MKPVSRLALSTLVAALAPAIALGHDEPAKESGRLGKVSFENSCAPEVQEKFNRSVAMLHSFWYSAAERSFTEVISEDPTCGIATWGLASILMSNPLAGRGALAPQAQKAQMAIELGRVMGAKTERERDYLEAVAAYYDDFPNKSERQRQVARAEAYQKLAAKYPKDDEAQIFAALYTAATQQQSDQTYAAYLKAAAVLEEQFKKYPDHPGVAHYLIHSYDAPPIAQKGLPAARLYATIAPDAPHALHMPSHIFTRVGAWEDSAATNLRSRDVARKGGEGDEAYHATDYTVYAYLQMGRDADARRAIDEASQIKGVNMNNLVAPYAIGAMNARYAVERNDWQAAMQLPMPPASGWAPTNANTHFARALGAARTGNVGMAREELAKLADVQRVLQEKNDKYWANEVEVQRLIVASWIAHAQKNDDDALRLARAAADLEDRSEKHIVTPGRLIPARELLGELLMETGKPRDALAEFEASRLREPNRLRNYYLSALAAESAGDKAAARNYWSKVATVAAKGDATRPELVKAKAALQ